VNPDRPPLILHVLHHLVIGGMENGLINLINRLPTDAYRHVVACVEDFSDFRDRIVRKDVDVIALHRSRIGAQGVRRELYRVCRRLRPALVHSRNQSGLDALLPARLAGVRRSVHSEHGWDVGNLDGHRWKPTLLRRIHSPLVDQYITVSKDLQRYLTEHIGIAPQRVTQIYNGVDIDRFAPAEAQRIYELPPGFSGSQLVRIGTVGRAQAIKDQATLLRAVAQLVQHCPELRSVTRVIVVGDGPLLANLRDLAHTLNMTDITWFPGASSDVPRLLQLLDVFVLPSLNEGISNTILEAMASGLPVVATAVGGNVELVEEGVTGRLFPPTDVAALAAHLEEYIQNPASRRRDGEAGRKAVIGKFSMAAMVDKYHHLYNHICRG
jgi:sugar transferase (PEP-CTERM/EpsH1 system associated)